MRLLQKLKLKAIEWWIANGSKANQAEQAIMSKIGNRHVTKKSGWYNQKEAILIDQLIKDGTLNKNAFQYVENSRMYRDVVGRRFFLNRPD